MIFTVFVDASDACNNMDFQFGNNGYGTTIPTRSWSIKVPRKPDVSRSIIELLVYVNLRILLSPTIVVPAHDISNYDDQASCRLK